MTGHDPLPDSRLTVLDGPQRGAVLRIPAGRSEVGRLPGSAIALPDATVSRHHAEIVSSATGVSIRDLGSANGTYVNGARLAGAGLLHDDDEVRLGTVRMRFSIGAEPVAGPRVTPVRREAAGTTTQPSSFGDVHGPVQTGPGTQYAAGGDQYVAHGDQFLDRSINVQDDYDPWDEIWQGRGPGRVLTALGGIVALVGFGLWMYFIFSGFGTGFEDMSNPFETEIAPGIPLGVAGFGLFALGGVLAGVGSGMSKAARKREERRARERGPRPGTRERRHGR